MSSGASKSSGASSAIQLRVGRHLLFPGVRVAARIYPLANSLATQIVCTTYKHLPRGEPWKCLTIRPSRSSVRSSALSCIFASGARRRLPLRRHRRRHSRRPKRRPHSNQIVVTARRREESLQDTPVAVTALSAEALERQQIVGTTDLDKIAPNLQFHSYGTLTGNNSAAQVFIRGIGQTDATPGGRSRRRHLHRRRVHGPRGRRRPWSSATSPACRSCAGRREPCSDATPSAERCC